MDKERTAITYEVTRHSANGQISKELREAGSGEQLWVVKMNSKEKRGKPEEKQCFPFLF